MWKWNISILHYKSVSWLVIAAVLMLTLIPVHLHFHHAEDDAMVTHEVDLHVVAGSADHSHDEDTHILKASPDAMAKKLDGNIAILLPVALLFLILSAVQSHHAGWLYSTPAQTRFSYHHLIPYLRAPPRH